MLQTNEEFLSDFLMRAKDEEEEEECERAVEGFKSQWGCA